MGHTDFEVECVRLLRSRRRRADEAVRAPSEEANGRIEELLELSTGTFPALPKR